MKKRIIYFTICCLIAVSAQAQTVSTLIEEFPGDGEMSFDSNGDIYVNDSGENGNLDGKSVWKVIRSTGDFSMFINDLPIWVVGSAFDLNENLLVTGWSAGTISRISPDGSSANTISNGIDGAGSLEVDELGNIYVVEYNSSRVLKFDSNGDFIESIATGAPIQNPAGLAYVQSTGSFYVSNWTNGDIVEIDADGNMSVFASLEFDGVLSVGPIKIFGNYMYATSPQYHKIYRVDMTTQEVSHFAGTGVASNIDGDINSATFNTPTGIGSLDGNTIYIAETFQGTGRLRVIEDVLGIENIASKKLKPIIYPNPTVNTLSLKLNATDLASIDVAFFDIIGQRIEIPKPKIQFDRLEFDTSSLSRGVYFLQLNNGNPTFINILTFIKE